MTDLVARAIAPVCALIPLCGCMTVKVSRGAPPASPPALESVRGIPFYTKTVACRHQGIWIERRYEITYSDVIAGDTGANRSGTKVLDQSHYVNIAALAHASGKTITDPAERAKYRTALDRILNAGGAVAPVARDVKALEQDHNVQLISDTASLQPYVDYSTLYYYNTSRPLIGTAKADVHLAPDGTLTEGNSELNDTTGSTIASLVTSLAGMAIGSGTEAAPASVPHAFGQIPGTSDTFTVSVVTRTYRHTIEEWNREAKDPSVCTATWRTPPAYSANTVTLELDEPGDEKQPEEKKDAVHFNGEVQLPRALDKTDKDRQDK